MNKKNVEELIDGCKVKLEGMLFKRYSARELVTEISNIIDEKLDGTDLVDCVIDGKTASCDEIYDDFFSFNIEKSWGDMYLDIYFIKTNDGLYFITEYALDYDPWKIIDLRRDVEICGFLWDEILHFEPNKTWEHNTVDENNIDDDWLVGKFTDGELWMNNNHGYVVLIVPPTDIRDTTYFFRYI